MRRILVSEHIKDIRQTHQLSQEQLANLLGVAHSTLHAWESGKRLPQEGMKKVILSLLERETILPPPTIENVIPFHPEQTGMFRTGAGFVSSLLDYQNRRDPLDFTHSIGRWYGSLPSFLVRDLVKLLITDFKVSGPALVNFSGSGTVALEFGLAGIECEAVDVNPIAVLLSYLKTQSIKGNKKKAAQFIEAAQLGAKGKRIKLVEEEKSTNLIFSDKDWVPSEIKSKVIYLVSKINELNDEDTKIIVSIALINIIIDFCNIDKRCTNHYVYKENTKNADSLYSALIEEVNSICDALSKLAEIKHFKKPSINIADNTALPFQNDYFDSVFSHPPYSNMINYYSISRVQLSIIELVKFKAKGLAFKSSLIDFVQRNDMSSGTLKKYNEGTEAWLKEAHRVMKKNGALVVIIGDSRSNGNLLHPHTHMIEVASKLGMPLKEMFIWVTNHKAGMHIQRKGHHIDHNYVMIFQKQ